MIVLTDSECEILLTLLQEAVDNIDVKISTADKGGQTEATGLLLALRDTCEEIRTKSTFEIFLNFVQLHVQAENNKEFRERASSGSQINESVIKLRENETKLKYQWVKIKRENDKRSEVLRDSKELKHIYLLQEERELTTKMESIKNEYGREELAHAERARFLSKKLESVVNQRDAAIGIQVEKEKELKIRRQAFISMQNTVLEELKRLHLRVTKDEEEEITLAETKKCQERTLLKENERKTEEHVASTLIQRIIKRMMKRKKKAKSSQRKKAKKKS